MTSWSLDLSCFVFVSQPVATYSQPTGPTTNGLKSLKGRVKTFCIYLLISKLLNWTAHSFLVLCVSANDHGNYITMDLGVQLMVSDKLNSDTELWLMGIFYWGATLHFVPMCLWQPLSGTLQEYLCSYIASDPSIVFLLVRNRLLSIWLAMSV